jgi:hypothetical protein
MVALGPDLHSVAYCHQGLGEKATPFSMLAALMLIDSTHDCISLQVVHAPKGVLPTCYMD